MIVERLMNIIVWRVKDDKILDELIIIMEEGELQFYGQVEEDFDWSGFKIKEKKE